MLIRKVYQKHLHGIFLSEEIDLQFNSFSIYFSSTVGSALFLVKQMLILNKSLSCK